MKRTPIFITVLFLISLVWSAPVSYAQGEAQLELRTLTPSVNAGDEVAIDIVLKNPSASSIISVRSWLSYDAGALEGVSVDTKNSPFTLSAPGEDTFSDSEGRVKIGRSNISGGVKEAESLVATVRFKVKSATPLNTKIGFYDYQVSELGHTSVNIIEEGFPVNILSKKPSDLTLALNGGGVSGSTVTVPTATIPTGSYLFTLARPEKVEISTGSGIMDVRWEAPFDSNRAGFNVYYGQKSGLYSRRKTVSGPINTLRIDGLINGQAYYVGITSYNALNQESDYSDEVAIIVGEPLSSTSPFKEFLASLLARVPEQPQNGPLVGWLAFSTLGLTGSIYFRKRKQAF